MTQSSWHQRASLRHQQRSSSRESTPAVSLARHNPERYAEGLDVQTEVAPTTRATSSNNHVPIARAGTDDTDPPLPIPVDAPLQARLEALKQQMQAIEAQGRSLCAATRAVEEECQRLA